MASFVTITVLLMSLRIAIGSDDDRFSYKYGSSFLQGKMFGVKQWDEVSCDTLGQCLGWPDGYESRRSFNLTDNHCRWCPAQGGPNCTHHRQSPINLERSKGIKGHPNENVCKDGHWMAYMPGSCKWQDIVDNDSSILRNNFVVHRHALQIKQPLNANGKLQCERNKFPRIDFAFGFPEWWLLYQTEIKTPSEHYQEGNQYAAEIQLDHVYQINRRQREIAKVAIFLDENSAAERWDFLDKLICQWREVEDATRKDCCLESVPPYPGCRNPIRPACTQADSNGTPGPGRVDNSTTTTESTTPDATFSSTVSTTASFETTTTTSMTSSSAPPQTTSKTGDIHYNIDPRPVRPGRPQKTSASTRTTAEPKTAVTSNRAEQQATTKSTSATGTTTEPEATQKTTAEPKTDMISTATATTTSDPVTTAVRYGTDGLPLEPWNEFSCESYPYINIGRMCKDGGCCETPRQDGGFCHKVYDVFGSNTALACESCCDTPKTVGPPAPDHPEYARIECSSIPDDTSRMCKAGGCCDGSDGNWCKDLRATYSSDEMRSICWYCCSEPRDIGRQRELESGDDVASKEESPSQGQLDEPIDFVSQKGADEAQRDLQTVNFDHVPYHAYEWMHKVNTEYYFRYVGTQSVPPCFTRVHWRVMKDPIHVHPMQIRELQRLLAWRIAPKDAKYNACQKDTAGRRVPGSNGDAVQVNRPLQAENPLHQITFCECKDWDSKSLDDQAWCNITNVSKRFYGHPYSFDTNGIW